METNYIKEEIEKQLPKLREAYFRANPSQRYKVAIDRLKSPEGSTNLLIQYVSAIEGFARSVALDFQVRDGISVDQAYGSLRNVNPLILIRDHIASRMNSNPEIIFGSDDWELFYLAVECRNFLVHEAGFVQQGYSNELIAVCERVFEKLARTAGVSATA